MALVSFHASTEGRLRYKITTTYFGYSATYCFTIDIRWISSDLKDIKQSGLVIQFSCLPYIDKNTSLKCLNRAKTRFNSIIQSKESQNIFIGLTWYSKKLTNEEGTFITDNNFEMRKKSINFLIDELKKNKKKCIFNRTNTTT